MQVNRSRDGKMKLKLTKREHDDMKRIAALCDDIARVLGDERSTIAKDAAAKLTYLAATAHEPEPELVA